MEVEIINDGPVTIQLDSRKFTYDDEKQGSATTPSEKKDQI